MAGTFLLSPVGAGVLWWNVRQFGLFLPSFTEVQSISPPQRGTLLREPSPAGAVDFKACGPLYAALKQMLAQNTSLSHGGRENQPVKCTILGAFGPVEIYD